MATGPRALRLGPRAQDRNMGDPEGKMRSCDNEFPAGARGKLAWGGGGGGVRGAVDQLKASSQGWP